jgi:hypothetical protein
MSLAEDIAQMIKIDRRRRPEIWAKADHIARLVDPSAFARWHDTDGHPHDPDIRQLYMQVRAINVAFDILRYLGLEPEVFDWTPIFEKMHGLTIPWVTPEEN